MWRQKALYLDTKRPVAFIFYPAAFSPPSSAEVKNMWNFNSMLTIHVGILVLRYKGTLVTVRECLCSAATGSSVPRSQLGVESSSGLASSRIAEFLQGSAEDYSGNERRHVSSEAVLESE
jgi:hypothetical protein